VCDFQALWQGKEAAEKLFFWPKMCLSG